MKGLITLTHLLSMLFFGMFIGGIIVGTDLWATGLILLIIDIVVGILLQRAYEKSVIDKYSSIFAEEDDEDINSIDILTDNFDFSDEENEKTDNDEEYYNDNNNDDDDENQNYNELIKLLKTKLVENYGKEVNYETEKSNPLYEKEFADTQYDYYLDLQSNGARLVNSINDDEMGFFLRHLCRKMIHAPVPYTLIPLCAISPEDLGVGKAIVYSFRYNISSYCENVFIFLVRTDENKLRFFTVETSCYKFMLCEYADGRHLNYGTVELKNVPTRIKEILNN